MTLTASNRWISGMLSDCSVLIATLCCLFRTPMCTCMYAYCTVEVTQPEKLSVSEVGNITFPKLPEPIMTRSPFLSLVHRSVSY